MDENHPRGMKIEDVAACLSLTTSGVHDWVRRFACKANRRTETCANHIVRPQRIAEAFGIPLTIWDCSPDTDATLEECQRIDVDPPATQ